jgi:two-component system OmpR family response regulator
VLTNNTHSDVIAAAGTTKDVVILHWPEQADRIDELERLGIPRLLLVEPESAPPMSTSCIEDWLRMPVDDASLRARLVALAAHARRHPMVPSLDEHGQLSHRGETVFLSITDQRIAEVLVEHFGQVVSEATLLERSRPDNRNDQTLRVNVSRLRRRVAPIGLAITCVRGHGYLMQQEIGQVFSA